MTRRLLLFFAAALAASAAPTLAHADQLPIGYVSYDVADYSLNGTPLLAEFDVSNLTGSNSLDPDFPVATPLTISNEQLLVTFAGGTTETFGPSYFTLDADGLSLDGTELSVLAGYGAGGLNGAISATLTGTVSPSSVLLTSGSDTHIIPNFSATISDPSGLTDGDLAAINVTDTPEPSAWILCATGLGGLLLLRRRLWARSTPVVATGHSGRVALGAALVLIAAARPGSALTLSSWTSPSSGTAGVSAVNLTGSGFPSGSVTAANTSVVLSSACGAGGVAARVNSVTPVIGSSDRIQFAVPAGLATGTYFVSVSGTTSSGNGFASSNCGQISITGASPVATLSTSSVSFSTLTAGTSAVTQQVTLSNTGTGNLNVTGLTFSGTGANLFSETSNCSGTLTPGAFCTVNVGFGPKVAGSYNGMLNIADNDPTNTQTVSLSGSATPAALNLQVINSTDWRITNGAMSLDFNPSAGRIFHIFLNGYSDDLTDQTNGLPGIYMDNTGVGGGSITTGYVNTGTYLDWWVTSPAASGNAWGYSMHFFVYPNDPGIHTYLVANHQATDPTGSIGQVQWVYRSNLNDFNNTYSVNQDLSNPGPVKIQLPPSSEMFSTDPGRAVQDATSDLHGFTLPASFTREFYTKYDYSQYNYLHRAHGTYGSTFGVWTYIPSNESLVAGPTKQNLVFTGNLLMMEAYSNHLDNGLTLTASAGAAASRLFGPYYFHFNAFGTAYNTAGTPLNTPDDMYADTLAAGASFVPLYDQQQTLIQNGYIPSTQRGSVSIQIPNVPALTGGAPKRAWAVLSDPGKNFQFSSSGYQYWADISQTGSAIINGIAPGTYRLSVYVLGQFGELRQDGITVSVNQTTTVPAVNFVPENFGTETVFTIGTPDRSSHEFLHGHDANGFDLRDYWGSWNYWADFAANNGAVVYNATSGPAGPATNDPTKWNYNHWGSSFDPGLFAGVYKSTDDTTDGYIYAIPSYVASLSTAKGTNGVLTPLPAWTVHFATPADIANYAGGYAILSVALACDYGSYVTTLNTTQRVWGYSSARYSDCSIRSGLSGYYQWFALQFPASALNQTPGADNTLTISTSQTYGAMDDALRLELSMKDATTATTGWTDYDYSNSNSTAHTVQSNDGLPNP